MLKFTPPKKHLQIKYTCIHVENGTIAICTRTNLGISLSYYLGMGKNPWTVKCSFFWTNDKFNLYFESLSMMFMLHTIYAFLLIFGFVLAMNLLCPIRQRKLLCCWVSR